MKLYYFMIIAIGLMYAFSLTGIETIGSRTLGMLVNNNITDTNVNPDVADYTGVTESSGILNYLTQNWWIIIAVAFALVIFVGSVEGIKVFGSGLELNPVNAIIGGLSAAIFFMFAVDFFNILLYMKDLTGGTGWEYHITWILIVPFLFGFGYTLIKFIQGTE